MAPRRFFTDEDKALLSVLVKANPILQSHKPDPTTSYHKKKKWKEVADIYNSNCKGQKRNVEQLRKCWKNMKFKEKQYRTSSLSTSDSQNGSIRRQALDIHSDTYDPIHLGSDDEPEYILPSVHDDDSDVLENSVQEDVFNETGCTIVEGLENAVIVEDDANIPVSSASSANFVRILPKPPPNTSQPGDIINDHANSNSTDLHMVEVHSPRPGSADSNVVDPTPKVRKVPKKTVTKYNRKSSNLDTKLLDMKIANEKIVKLEAERKIEFLDLKVKMLMAEEARKKDKHKREMMLLDSQIKYWQEKKKHLDDDSLYMS